MSPQAILFPLPLLVPEQEQLTGYIPTVMGPVEFLMLLQSFCKLERIDTVRIPGKSALERYGQWLPEEERRKGTGTLLGAAASAVEDTGAQTLALTEARLPDGCDPNRFFAGGGSAAEFSRYLDEADS